LSAASLSHSKQQHLSFLQSLFNKLFIPKMQIPDKIEASAKIKLACSVFIFIFFKKKNVL